MRVTSSSPNTFLHPYEFNLPLKAPLSELKNISFPENKAARTLYKIEALKSAWFPIQDQQTLSELFDQIRIFKACHMDSQTPERPGFFHTAVNGQTCNIDIYPFCDHSAPDGVQKTRHDVVLSFPFSEDNEALDPNKHINTGNSKQISFGWSASKQPKRFVIARSSFYPHPSNLPYAFNASQIQHLIQRRKKIAGTEAAFMKLFANSPGFPKVYKSFDTAEGHILLMKHYQKDLFDCLTTPLGQPGVFFPRLLDDYSKIQIAIGVITPIVRMHEQGIIHRDIKQENYLVDGMQEIVLTDLGYACKADAPEASEFKGTPVNMPWERLKYITGKAAPHALTYAEQCSADVWGAGQILMHLFFDILFPYMTEVNFETISEHDLMRIHKEMEIFSRCEPPQENKLLHLVWEMLHLDPAYRPAAADVKKALLETLQEYSESDKTYSLMKVAYNPWEDASASSFSETETSSTTSMSSSQYSSISESEESNSSLIDSCYQA